jgi:hypothetical protein
MGFESVGARGFEPLTSSASRNAGRFRRRWSEAVPLVTLRERLLAWESISTLESTARSQGLSSEVTLAWARWAYSVHP